MFYINYANVLHHINVCVFMPFDMKLLEDGRIFLQSPEGLENF